MATFGFDIIIVGAGVAGINAAYRLQTDGPSGMSYTILENRSSIGGTWDLFRYPGVRTDSDILPMGAGIREYMKDSAKKAGIDQHIQYNRKVKLAKWDSTLHGWELSVMAEGQDAPTLLRSRFLYMATGYYDYGQPLQSTIPGIEDFQGKVIHPQFWHEDYDCTDQKVVVIGSGATAISIVPHLADRCSALAQQGLLDHPGLHHAQGQLHLAGLGQEHDSLNNKKLLPPHVPIEPHFQPKYNPWDQRLCVSMDGDIFNALRAGKASIVTDTIKTVTKEGITLDSEAELDADVIVTATGLRARIGGGICVQMDGKELNLGSKFLWRSAMLQDIPNLFVNVGFPDASWTLGCDCVTNFVTRLLLDMRMENAVSARPHMADKVAESIKELPIYKLNSTYVISAAKYALPKTGDSGVWRPRSYYVPDLLDSKYSDIRKDVVFEY